jgi:hypothetical protein
VIRTVTSTLLVWSLLSSLALGHVPGCRTKACDRRIHEKRRAHWIRTHIWEHRWHHLSVGDRAWARCIAHWETFGTPWHRKARVNTGNGYQGAVQFSAPTAHAAGFIRPVAQTSLHEQLVRAVWWRNRAGASQWSTSGRCA